MLCLGRAMKERKKERKNKAQQLETGKLSHVSLVKNIEFKSF